MRTAYLFIALALAACQKGNAAEKAPKLSLPPAPASGAKLEIAPPPSQAAMPGPSGARAASGSSSMAPMTAPDGSPRSAILTGTTAPRRTSQVSASGSGLLMELLVHEGDYVESGQVIAQLDHRDAKLRIRQAEAGMRAARVQVAGTDRELKRLEKLNTEKAIATAEVDRLRTQNEAAAAGLASAEAALAMARKMDGDAVVRAPFAGLVTARLKGEGEWISTMPPAPLIALAEITPLDLRVDVPASLLSKLKAGDSLKARFTALDREVTARITRIVPQVQPQTRTFTVIAELPNADRALAPGLFAEVVLEGDVQARSTP